MKPATPYAWPGQRRPQRMGQGTGRHAVVLSWHVAPDFGWMPGQDRMLAIWAEPLLDQLLRDGARTTLLLAMAAPCLTPAAETALGQALAARGIELAIASGAEAMARAEAVDAALAALAPDIVHAPERLGLALVALGRRAGGLAHPDTSFVLHARGGTLYQMEEACAFIADTEALRADEMERQAMRLADGIIAAGPSLALACPAATLAAPVVWPAPVVQAQPASPITELVFPLPLGSEAGLEFALAALARAAQRRPFPLPVTFLGQPAAVTIGTAAQALAGLGALEARLQWRLLPLETPQQACRYLAQPGRLALFTGARGTPPEWLEFCGQAGIPALATENAETRDAASRWPGIIHVAPRAERGFAGVLAALLVLPPQPEGQAVPVAASPPALTHQPASPARLLAAISAPATPDLTVFCAARPGLLASLDAQELASFATEILCGQAMGAAPRPPAARPLRLRAEGPDGLPAALAACTTRFAVLTGEARALRPAALRALRHAALVSAMPAITCWDSASQPLGGGADLALLCPGSTLGHLVLLDLPALRALGGRSLAAAGSAQFAGLIAEDSGGVLLLPQVLADAAAPPAPVAPPPLAGLPRHLAGVPAMALFYAASPPREDPTEEAMARANRDSAHYLKLAGRLLDAAGQHGAAADAWDALLARDNDDGETWTRHAWHALRRHGRVADLAGLAAFIARHGIGALGEFPEALAREAEAMARDGHGPEAVNRLAPLLPLLHAAPGFLAALALAHASCPPALREARAWPPLPAGPAQAWRLALGAHGLAPGAHEVAPGAQGAWP